MYCRNCGKDIGDNTDCPYCKVGDVSRKKFLIPLLVVLCVCITGAAAIGIYLLQNGITLQKKEKGDTEKAVELLKCALELQPENPYMEKLLKEWD